MYYLKTQIYPTCISQVIITSLCIENETYYKGSVPISKAQAQELVELRGIDRWDKQCEEVGAVIPLILIHFICTECGAKLSKSDFEADMCPACEAQLI